MKIIPATITIILIVTLAACSGKGGANKPVTTDNDTVMVPDTGFTGIKQYAGSNNLVVKEVTFKNGIREGCTNTYYRTGELYQTFWYENGLRQDTSHYYFTEGQLFRKTPYVNDTIHGIQIQYYRTGKLRAKLGFDKGRRTTYIEEYLGDGNLYRDYPEIVVNTTDEYDSKGVYRIGLELSDGNINVKFHQGEIRNDVIDTTLIRPLNTVKGKAQLDLRKSDAPGQNQIGVVAEMVTPFRNRHFIYKEIDLPYNDLK